MQKFSFPQVLTQVGAVGEEGQPIQGMPFYRLTGATVRQGVSAFMVVTVFSQGAPKISAKVVNLFPDGNGEVIETDGSGNARFQFGASSAFTTPGTGPFTIFIADDGAFKDFDVTPKRVVFSQRLSDIVRSLGDFRGEHTEIFLQFVEQDLSGGDGSGGGGGGSTGGGGGSGGGGLPPQNLDGLIAAFEQVVAELKKLKGS